MNVLPGELSGQLLTRQNSPTPGTVDESELTVEGRGVAVGPQLQRFQSAVSAPWEYADYRQEDVDAYLQSERESLQALFKAVIDKNTSIAKSAMARPPAELTFKDVAFSLRKPDGTMKPILEPCSGHYKAGSMVAVMGPSGCGKSTLLDMLANKKTASYSGTIMMNGRPRDRLFQRVASYVGQEDVMPQHWTVREAVLFNWQLKVERTTRTRRISGFAVEMLLGAFGLSAVADTYIGGPSVRGISGGQKRRVTLARGVAARASVMFCDEPTSGLSATDAELCVRALRIMAKKFGVLIMVVIHQPRVEVADLFDELLLLTSGPGRVIYNGPMGTAVRYWGDCGYPVPTHANPTDFFLDLVTPGGPKDASEEFVHHFREKQQAEITKIVDAKLAPGCEGLTVVDMLTQHYDLQVRAGLGPQPMRPHPVAAPFSSQISTLFRRKVTLTMRNPAAVQMPIMVPVLIGVLMGVMFQGVGKKPLANQLSFVFMLLTRICMGGMQLMPTLIDERIVMKYDISESLYSVEAYIIVGQLIDITVSIVGALLNVVIMYAFSELSWKYFGLLVSWAILNFFVFDSFFSLLAAAAPTLAIAQVAAIPFNSAFMMFSGFMISKASSPSYLRWIFEISPIGYAVQSIFVYMADDFGLEGQRVVNMYGFEKGQETKGISILVGMVVVLRVGQVFALKFLNNIQK